jgi:energy-coupling factor transporter ATP-binding protein EcfA2
MVETKEDFSEQSLLIGMIVSDEFLARIVTIDIDKYLSSRYSKLLASWIIQYYESYSKCPGSSITELVNSQKRILDPTVNELIHKIVEYAAERYGTEEDVFDLAYSLDSAQKYIQSRALIIRREEEERLLENGDVFQAYKLVTDFKLPTIIEGFGKQQLSEVLPSLAVTFEELNSLDFTKKEYILHGDFPIEKGSITMVVGAAGSGKTWFTTELSRIIASGSIGLAGTCNTGDITRTLIVDGELPIHEIYSRSKILELEDIRHLSLISKSLLERNDVTPSLDITNASVREILTDYIVTNGFGLVILDNLFSLCSGLDLSSAEEWQPINEWFLKLRSKDICVIISHHLSKDGTAFGSISRLFNINNCLLVRKEIPQDQDSDCCCFSISIIKQRGTGIRLQGKKFIFRNKIWTTEPFSGRLVTKSSPPKTQPEPIPKPIEPTPRPSLKSGLKDRPIFRVYKKEE